jgi:hypothetical protein
LSRAARLALRSGVRGRVVVGHFAFACLGECACYRHSLAEQHGEVTRCSSRFEGETVLRTCNFEEGCGSGPRHLTSGYNVRVFMCKAVLLDRLVELVQRSTATWCELDDHETSVQIHVDSIHSLDTLSWKRE